MAFACIITIVDTDGAAADDVQRFQVYDTGRVEIGGDAIC